MTDLRHTPAPKNRAELDSLLYSLADELVPAATCATFATASDGVGDIAMEKEGRCNEKDLEANKKHEKWVSTCGN